MKRGKTSIASVFGPERIIRRISLLVAVLAAACASLNAQQDIRVQFFRDVDALYSRAKETNADVLAPKSFTRAMDTYLDAKDALQRGRPVDEVQQRVRLAIRYFNAALEAGKPAGNLFAAPMAARSAAMSADAIRLVPELWNKAEGVFRSAATALEEGNPGSARAEGGEAQGLYGKAELEAIKAKFFASTRSLLDHADALNVKSTAPQTLNKARNLAAQAEAAVQENRYDNTEARRLAEEANYEAAHAIYLHQVITRLQSQGRSLEEALLIVEREVAKVGEGLSTQIHFDAGMESAIRQIIAAVKTKDPDIAPMADSLNALRAANEALRRQLSLQENSAAPLGGQDSGLHRLKEERAMQDKTIALAGLLFTIGEGTVTREGNNVLIRINGLEFSPGKAAIEPQHAALLSKIQRAIRLFPNCQLTIEGHIERSGTGTESSNQRISEMRASAVAEYLRDALPPSTPILSQGFGSSRPIADNVTSGGRRQNRRIDIIIIPEWAIVGR